jgi:hypothetical protein
MAGAWEKSLARPGFKGSDKTPDGTGCPSVSFKCPLTSCAASGVCVCGPTELELELVLGLVMVRLSTQQRRVEVPIKIIQFGQSK